MAWTIDFIKESDFENHVEDTIKQYGDALKPFDVARFNKNIIDPVKMMFDKAVFGSSWKDIISAEITRQRDKTNTNDIGYFHQRMFKFIKNCHVPDNGEEGGWDVIVDLPDGYSIDSDNTVHKIYAEVKNKHNTMNGPASNDTFIKMMDQMHEDDDCVCMLVEAIAKHRQNIVWKKTVRGKDKPINQRRIRRVSIDEFYSLITGQEDAFYQICMALPDVINKVLAKEDNAIVIPKDTVYDQLKDSASKYGDDENKAFIIAMYMLGFSEYAGFSQLDED